jgi:exodeoxyribonuclease VII small subunit
MSKLNYTQAFEELQAIVAEMENGKISVDELAIKVKRASELIKTCKNKLTETEGDVQKILSDLDENQ